MFGFLCTLLEVSFSRLSTGETDTNPQDSGFGRANTRPKGECHGGRESTWRVPEPLFQLYPTNALAQAIADVILLGD